MRHRYVFIVNDCAYLVSLVNTNLAHGKFQILSESLGTVHFGKYETVEEAETFFNSLVFNGTIKDWYPLGEGKQL